MNDRVNPMRGLVTGADVVAILLRDDTVKVIKDRYGHSGVTYSKVMFEELIAGYKVQCPERDLKVLRIPYAEALVKLKGLISL